MKVSEIIRERLESKNIRYFACDNISEYITDAEREMLILELTDKFNDVLESLVIDRKNDPNSKGTGKRLAKMYVNEIMSGRYFECPEVTAFPNTDKNKYEGMIVIRAELRSVCSHHHQPVKGVAYIGIIPSGKVIGLSKYIRLAQWCARRGTLQEELCNDIASVIMEATESNDVGVYIAAVHGCCENRGIMAHSSLTQTTVLNGQFHSADVKEEFFNNIALQEKFTDGR